VTEPCCLWPAVVLLWVLMVLLPDCTGAINSCSMLLIVFSEPCPMQLSWPGASAGTGGDTSMMV
jgi:hypothetical protein